MHLKVVFFVLSNLLLVLGVCILAPLGVSIVYAFRGSGSAREIIAFAVTVCLTLTIGWVGRKRLATATTKLGVREGFAIVTFGWLAAVLIGMLPFLISGVSDSITDAFFETMSGFTTTGATIFPIVEIIPHGVQFWRCMTQWLGGMGIVVLSVALLPMLGAGGYRMLKAESPGGVAFERESPRITDAAKSLWKLYLGFTAAQIVLLLISGMTVFDAICHAFTTMSTGGFSPHSASIAYFPSAFTQWIIIVFMLIAGVNFSLYASALRGSFRPVFKNPELLLYLALVFGVSLIGVCVVENDGGVEKTVRDVVFQVASIGTTTGFATVDYDFWPHLMRFLLLGLMFVGGSMGSTAGGMKVARLLIFVKAFLRELHRPIYPRAVKPIRVGDKVIEDSLVANILAFGMLFVISFCVGSLVMTACGYDLDTSMSAAVAALGNVGPGLAQVGPTANWSHLPDVAKWVMSFLMLIGRLEIYSVLVLLTPWAWRR